MQGSGSAWSSCTTVKNLESRRRTQRRVLTYLQVVMAKLEEPRVGERRTPALQMIIMPHRRRCGLHTRASTSRQKAGARGRMIVDGGQAQIYQARFKGHEEYDMVAKV